MRIAVTSQNRIAVTSHAGMCRRFLVYGVDETGIRSKDLVEIGKDEVFRNSREAALTRLGPLDVLLTGGMGSGLRDRLAASGIRALVTSEEDPDRAVAAFLDGSLAILEAGEHHHGDDPAHHHDHS